jgi:hypothetical protein
MNPQFLHPHIFLRADFPPIVKGASNFARMACLLTLATCGLMLLASEIHAQSNMCYPMPGKRSPLKKGACFMVSHTLPEFLGLDTVRF